MFCCKNARAAGKAILFSSLGQLITLLMLLIGTALFVDKHQEGFGDQELATVFGAGLENVQDIRDAATFAEHPETGARSNVIVPQAVKVSSGETLKGTSDYIFPIWIVMGLPVGLSGLILAGVFAAAISSLDSILAALSQTTLSLFYHPERGNVGLSERQLMLRSRLLVVVWGGVLTAFTLLLAIAREDIPILPLAFGMTTYTVGPLLAFFLCAMIGRGSLRGLLIGSLISFVAVMFVQTDIWVLLIKAGVISAESLATLFTYELNASGNGVKSVYCFAWMWPLTCLITLGAGLIVPCRRKV
jgi:hypothetical protein